MAGGHPAPKGWIWNPFPGGSGWPLLSPLPLRKPRSFPQLQGEGERSKETEPRPPQKKTWIQDHRTLSVNPFLIVFN